MNLISNPILATMFRGPLGESFHRGAWVILDQSGSVVASQGDVERLIYPRSAIKPLQILPTILYADENDQLSLQEVALACASHNGEPIHIEVAEKWAKRLGIKASDLACGVIKPIGPAPQEDLSVFHNQCSGNHLGILNLAKCKHFSLENYYTNDHPAQQIITHHLKEFCDLTHPIINGIDGCRIPTIAMNLKQLATGMGRLLEHGQYSKAAERVIAAMQNYPELMGGANRFCTKVIQASSGQMLVKMGAEGMCSGINLKNKWGFAIKIDDGDGKAAEIVTAHILKQFGWCDINTEYPLLDNAKNVVGHWEVSLG